MTRAPSFTAKPGLTIGSLFSGIGGLELGLERAGLGPVRWQVEIDPYCRAVLARHWPDARRYEDVRSVGPELERVDLICGGFPCQDISGAGKKVGLSGARSGLWWQFSRVVRVVRPRFVVVENVSALASRGLDEVVGRLAEDGYDSIWFPVAAADVGAPHLRERIFVVGYADQHGESDLSVDAEASGVRDVGHAASAPEVAYAPGRSPRDSARQSGSEVADSSSVGFQRARRTRDGRDGPSDGGVEMADADSRGWVGRGQQDAGRSEIDGTECDGGWIAEPDVGRVADGVPNRTHRLTALGNAVVPQVAEVVGWVVRGIAERCAS